MLFLGTTHRIFMCFLLIFALIIGFVWNQPDVYGEDSEKRPIELSEEERSWIKANPGVRLGIDPAWPPFEWFDENGKYNGISSEYIDKIEAVTGLKIEPVAGLSWAEVISGLKNGSLDMSAAMTMSPKREEYLKFTRPFVTYPSVIMTRTDQKKSAGLEQYNGQRVGVGRGYIFQELMERLYPDVDLVLYDTAETGLSALAVGNIEAYVGNLGVISYITQKNNLANLEVAGQAQGFGKTELRMATRKDLPELASILDKSLASISKAEQQAIAQRWVKIEVSAIQSDQTIVNNGHYTSAELIYQGFFFIILFCALAYLFTHLMSLAKKDPLKSELDSLQIRLRVILFNAILVALILLGTS